MTLKLVKFFLVQCALVAATGLAQTPRVDIAETGPVQSLKVGQIVNFKCVDGLGCSGQFTPADIPLLKEQKFERIISLRTETEIDWNEKSEVEKSGIAFLQIPIAGPTGLTNEIFDRVRTELRKSGGKTLLHCGVGARAAAVWLPHRVLDQGKPLEQAVEEAKTLGLAHPGMRDAAIAYIKQTQATMATQSAGPNLTDNPASDQKIGAQSVKPGINKDFLDQNLNVDEFVKRFEMESREIFVAREKILAACKLDKGMTVADIGAGTGLFSRMFSVSVGGQGWVYAIDISPRFLEHINRESIKFGLNNISAVLCTEKNVSLSPASVDVVFVCDTYHHFEYPQATLKSIFSGMKPGAILNIVDFERIPDFSREWILDHVRAGKDIVRQEVEAAGFEFVEEVEIVGLEENYFLRFRKPLK